jgi:hypothetical protein
MGRDRQIPLQRAGIDIRLGGGSLRVATEMTSGGLLAIGGLIAAILLSTAVLVGVATRPQARAKTIPPDPNG